MVSISTHAAELAFLFLFFLVLSQLKGSIGVKQSSVSYSYHLLVPVTDGQPDSWNSNGSYSWVHGGFGPCSMTCGGGNHSLEYSVSVCLMTEWLVSSEIQFVFMFVPWCSLPLCLVNSFCRYMYVIILLLILFFFLKTMALRLQLNISAAPA